MILFSDEHCDNILRERRAGNGGRLRERQVQKATYLLHNCTGRLSVAARFKLQFKEDAFTIASSAADGLKTWTYTGSPGARRSPEVAAARDCGAAQCARFNHNGQVIVGAGASGVITLWHTNGTVLGELVRNKDRGQPIHSLFFSSGSRYLATGGVDRVVKIWDLKRREIIRSFKSHKTAVSCVQFSKDADKFVASGALSGKVCVFNVLSGRLVNTLEPPETPEVPKSASSMGVQAVSFSPFRKSILAAAYNDGCARGISEKIWLSFQGHSE